ncbi:hypothetical protein DXV76_15135 [Rhodobacteraceae bacterium CCMM004]|nr:hypothetical protein DXV76_15135 [Rhodobacteraceae bacterium CCMM004]
MIRDTVRRFAVRALALAVLAAPAAAEDSAFGCVGLDQDADLPVIEGRDGMFFRVTQDIWMQRRYSDGAVAEMADLSAALAARGTTLILALVPTKAATMPHLLPERAAWMGFDVDTAVAVQRDIHDRLNAAGVATVDLQAALFTEPGAPHPFFRADTHWNAVGAERAAEALAAEIRAHPSYDGLPKTAFETVAMGPATVFSAMRRIVQKRCRQTIPEPVTTRYETRIDAAPAIGALDIGLDDAPLDIGLEDAPLDIGLDDGADGALDIFGAEAERLPIALVGTSFSDLPEVNFPGFLAQHAGVEVINYAITGGGQYSAIASYLTSDDFQTAPPSFLIWESPIYLNPTNDGDQPLRELIAAAGGTCTVPVDVVVGEGNRTLRADLPTTLGPESTLFLDTGSRSSREVSFRFVSAEGRTRTRVVRRGERMRLNGRFYMPAGGLWSGGAAAVEITGRLPFGAEPRLFTCDPTQS